MKCTYYRWRISREIDADNESDLLPHDHLSRCPGCRRFYQDSIALGRSLQLDARAMTASEKEPHLLVLRRPSRRLAWVATISTAAAAIAVALVIWLSARPQTQTPIVIIPPPPPTTPGVTPTEALTQARERVQSMAFLAAKPFVDEINSTADDAKSTGKAILAHVYIYIPQQNQR